MENYSFEETVSWTQEEYLELFSVLSKSKRPIRRLCILIVGIGCLFSSYTLIFGIAILSFLFVAVVLNKTIPFLSNRSYKENQHYHQPIKYGISNHKIWADFDKFSVSSKWENLAVWQQQGKWLRLSVNALPPLFFKIESLENSGIFGAVMEQAKINGVEFGSPEAKKLSNNKINRMGK